MIAQLNLEKSVLSSVSKMLYESGFPHSDGTRHEQSFIGDNVRSYFTKTLAKGRSVHD